MKTYKLGESEMNERKVNFDFRHVQTIDHGNGMVTEIMACYMPTGTLLRFSDCIIDEDRNVHVIAVNYQLDPGITGAQMMFDPAARIYPVANITDPYLEHEAKEGKIEYSEESSPIDSSVNPAPDEDEEEADDEDSDDDNELYISEQEQEKLNKLLNAGDDDEVSEETESVIEPITNKENSVIQDGKDAPEPVESSIATFDDDDDDETGCAPEAPNPKKYEEKARKHYVNNNNQKQKWNNNKKKNKGYDNRRDNRNNHPKENSSFENSLLNAISKGWN